MMQKSNQSIVFLITPVWGFPNSLEALVFGKIGEFMSLHCQIRPSSELSFARADMTESEFVQVFCHLRADVTAMRSRCMQITYSHDHKVWRDLHDLERALSYAEETMNDLSKRIIMEHGT